MFENIKNYFTGREAQRVTAQTVPVGRGNRVYVDANGDLTYATCLNILANNIAQCKWGVFDQDWHQKSELVLGLNRVLNIEPYPGINAYDFWEYMERQRLANGNAYAYIYYKGTELKHLVPLEASRMKVVWDDANILEGQRRIVYKYTDQRTNQEAVMLPEEVLHFKAFSANGIIGRPAVEVLSNALASGAEVEGAIRSAVQNGFAGTMILSYTSDLSPTKQKELQKQVKELLANANSTILPLPVGMSASNISNDVRSYFDTLKQTKTKEISALFNIPLAMLNEVGGTGAATFSAAQMNSFFTQTIKPILTRYATELNNKLLTRRQQDTLQIATVNDGLELLDEMSKATVLNSYKNAGTFTTNNVLGVLHYPKSDDPNADVLMHANGVGMVGDTPGNEGGNQGE